MFRSRPRKSWAGTLSRQSIDGTNLTDISEENSKKFATKEAGIRWQLARHCQLEQDPLKGDFQYSLEALQRYPRMHRLGTKLITA
jgi:hypothetical protein